MNRAGRYLAVTVAVLGATVPVSAASDFRLAPFKDELFAYRNVLASEFGGDLVTVAFDRDRDVVRRDVIPEQRVRRQYVSLGVNASQSDLVLRTERLAVSYVGVGKTAGPAELVVVFVHGLWATRFDGVDDWKYGGNLNRIKNLVTRSGGVYLSPDFSERSRSYARREVAALVADHARRSPEAPVILVCASLGGTVCVDLVRDAEAGPLVDGLIFVASAPGPGFLGAPAAKGKGRRIPVYIAAGTADPLVIWQEQRRLFRTLRERVPGYPVKLVLFQGGAHRAPLRMIDWRLAINWILDIHAGLPATAPGAD